MLSRPSPVGITVVFPFKGKINNNYIKEVEIIKIQWYK